MRPRVAGVERTLQECNENTVNDFMMLLHYYFTCKHVHVLLCVAFLIW